MKQTFLTIILNFLSITDIGWKQPSILYYSYLCTQHV